ncbi:MAG: D-mannonate dehydratase ManD [Opitutales bacterium]
MRITGWRVHLNSPGRNFLTLELETDTGLVGLGDGTLNGREHAVRAYLEEHLLPCLEGRDAFATEDFWQYAYRGAYWRRGPVTMTAIGAVDLALWDLKGKVLGVPVYQLLGGRCRQGVMAYTHCHGQSVPALIESAKAKQAEGFRALRLQCAVPGLDEVYGAPKAAVYEPAEEGALPKEEIWDTAKYLDFAPELFGQARAALGSTPHLLHDAHHRLTPIEAARLGQALEPYRLFWLEDAVTGELQEAFRLVRQHTTTPLALGEVFSTVFDIHQLITNQWIDYVRMAPTHGGGLTALRKIAALAEPYHVRMACHGPSDISPIGLAAAIHFGLATHNAAIQEFMGHPPETLTVFKPAYRFDNGYLNPGEEPGLGVAFDTKAAAAHPYRRAYLPTARLEDGTAWSW